MTVTNAEILQALEALNNAPQRPWSQSDIVAHNILVRELIARVQEDETKVGKGLSEELLDETVSGLLTDGSHHKQWHLWRLYALLGGKRTAEEMGVEEGVAP